MPSTKEERDIIAAIAYAEMGHTGEIPTLAVSSSIYNRLNSPEFNKGMGLKDIMGGYAVTNPENGAYGKYQKALRYYNGDSSLSKKEMDEMKRVWQQSNAIYLGKIKPMDVQGYWNEKELSGESMKEKKNAVREQEWFKNFSPTGSFNTDGGQEFFTYMTRQAIKNMFQKHLTENGEDIALDGIIGTETMKAYSNIAKKRGIENPKQSLTEEEMYDFIRMGGGQPE